MTLSDEAMRAELITEPHDGHGPDETCPGCPHTQPTDEAIRAEAKRRWGNRRTSDRLPNDWLNEGMASGFVLGAMWAREQTAPTVAPDVETIASVIAEHGSLAPIPDVGTECECGQVINGPDEFYETGWRTHQAEAVSAADPRRTEAEVKAEALEEAEDALWSPDTPGTPLRALRWLRDRAARLRDETNQ